MLRVFVCRNGLAVGIVLAIALAPTIAGPDASDKDKDGPAAKIKKQLDRPVTLDANEQTLGAALSQLREQTKINFVVDRTSIQQMGLDPEQMPVSAKLKDVKARTALRTILGPYNLGYAIIGDTVLISTDDMAMYRQLHQRINFDLEKVALTDALKKLSKDTGANVLLDPRVPAKEAKSEVTLQMEDVPLETGVRLMSEMAGLKPVKVGNVLFVTTKAYANQMRAEGDPNQPGGQPVPTVIDQAVPAAPGGLPGGPPVNPPPPVEKLDTDKLVPPTDKTEPAKPGDDKVEILQQMPKIDKP